MGVFYFYLAIESWKCFPYYPAMYPPHYYFNKFDKQYFDNYPYVKTFVTSARVANKNNPGLPEEELWMKNQFPSFYLHHFKNYRYILRTRRVVPWDGTYNQPAFPYTNNNDRTGLVHNGTNEIIERSNKADW